MKHELNTDQAELGTKVGNHLKRYSGGKGRFGKRVFTALSGCTVGKLTGFSHLDPALTRLFPHNSTQVVDFPHLAMVSQAELGTNMGKTNENEQGKRSHAELGTSARRLAKNFVCWEGAQVNLLP